MKETKIQLNQRKIRNQIRKQKEREQKQIWKRLSRSKADYFPELIVTKKSVIGKSQTIKAGWTADTVVINGLSFDDMFE